MLAWSATLRQSSGCNYGFSFAVGSLIAMQMYKSEDAQLANVKAVLLRLQRLSPGTGGHAASVARSRISDRSPQEAHRRRADFKVVEQRGPDVLPPLPAVYPSTGQIASAEVRQNPSTEVRQSRWVIAGAMLAFIASAVGLSTLVEAPVSNEVERYRALSEANITIDGWTAGGEDLPRETAEVAALPIHPSTASSLVDTALGESAKDLAAGLVFSARNRLQALSGLESGDVSWGMARTFDPNVLGALSLADASSSPETAELWYRRWHAQRVAKGRTMDDAMLERTIRSMH
jgi:hypothetical protein